jgi:hypothetical protein
MLPYRHLSLLLLPFVLLTCSKQEGNQNPPQETITEVVEGAQNSQTIPQPGITADTPGERQNILRETGTETGETAETVKVDHIEKRGQLAVDDKVVEYVHITDSSGDEIERDAIVEIEFVNQDSQNKIGYTGAYYRGMGLFWTYVNGNKTEIVETGVRYGPWICWQGEHIAEIVVPTGSPFTHSYYYNFIENTVSERYSFPLYYDVDTNYVLVWGRWDFELYDVKTNALIKTYERTADWDTFYPPIKWHIEKTDANTIIIYWTDGSDENGTITLDYR